MLDSTAAGLVPRAPLPAMVLQLIRKPRTRLHIGSGRERLEGWVNIDNQALPGVDVVADVTLGLRFSNVEAIFAEHFIEHLPFWECERFLRDCRNALAADGVLRLSTPNLDWVVATQYSGRDHVRDCFALNTSFRGWGHQFLFNAATLGAVLKRAGFAKVEFLTYGGSPHAELQGLERHEKSPDTPALPHVLVVEASGIGTTSNPALETSSAEFLQTLGAS